MCRCFSIIISSKEIFSVLLNENRIKLRLISELKFPLMWVIKEGKREKEFAFSINIFSSLKGMITEKKPFSDNNKEMLFSSSSKGRFSVKRAISLFLFFEKIVKHFLNFYVTVLYSSFQNSYSAFFQKFRFYALKF